MMPTMGNLTLVVAVLSYAGQLNLTAAADRDSCPDVEVFVQGVRRALDDLARSVACACDRRARSWAELVRAVGQRSASRGRPNMGFVTSDGCDLYYEEAGEGAPILLIHPAGATASTWGAATDELARIGRVITYDRRGYARSGGEPARSISTHTADAAAILEYLRAPPAVVVGTSAGATIAVDLAVRRPELVRTVVAHEAAWRAIRHLPTASQVAAVAKIGSLVLRDRHSDAAEALFAPPTATVTVERRGMPSPRSGGGRQGERPCSPGGLRNSIGNYPPPQALATITVPVVCTYGARSPDSIARLTRSLAAAIPTAKGHRIEGAGHAAPFDATANFVELIADSVLNVE